jgi:hypothetical protein
MQGSATSARSSLREVRGMISSRDACRGLVGGVLCVIPSLLVSLQVLGPLSCVEKNNR